MQCKTVKLKMIHTKVVSHNKNKMEAGFGDSNSVLIESLKDSAQKRRKEKGEIEDHQPAATWKKEKGHDENIESYETGELSKVLEQF